MWHAHLLETVNRACPPINGDCLHDVKLRTKHEGSPKLIYQSRERQVIVKMKKTCRTSERNVSRLSVGSNHILTPRVEIGSLSPLCVEAAHIADSKEVMIEAVYITFDWLLRNYTCWAAQTEIRTPLPLKLCPPTDRPSPSFLTGGHDPRFCRRRADSIDVPLGRGLAGAQCALSLGRMDARQRREDAARDPNDEIIKNILSILRILQSSTSSIRIANSRIDSTVHSLVQGKLIEQGGQRVSRRNNQILLPSFLILIESLVLQFEGFIYRLKN